MYIFLELVVLLVSFSSLARVCQPQALLCAAGECFTSAHVAVFLAKRSLVSGPDAGFLDKASGAWLRSPFIHMAEKVYAMILEFRR